MHNIYAVLCAVLLCGGMLSSAEAATRPTTATTTSAYVPATEVEVRVRSYFAKAPAMIEIARCESKFRHFNDAGSVLRGGVGGGMIGVFQFYEAVHAAGATALGLDLATLEGNLAYARHIYETQGTTPWSSSQACWSVPVVATTTALAAPVNRAQLLEQINLLTKLIALLQKQLDAKLALRR